jgi:hypothetical protein
MTFTSTERSFAPSLFDPREYIFKAAGLESKEGLEQVNIISFFVPLIGHRTISQLSEVVD